MKIFINRMYNSLTFDAPSHSLPSSLSFRGAKQLFVIASLNTLAFRRGNLGLQTQRFANRVGEANLTTM